MREPPARVVAHTELAVEGAVCAVSAVPPNEDDVRAAAEVLRERLKDALPSAGGAAYEHGGGGVGLADGGV